MKERVDESISVLFICPVLLRTTRMRMQRMEESGGGWSRIRRQIFWWINGQLTDGSGFVVSPNPDGRAESFSAPFPEYSSSLSLPLSSSLFFLSHCFYLLGQREEKEERQRLFFLFFFMCVCTRSFSFTLSLSLSLPTDWFIHSHLLLLISNHLEWHPAMDEMISLYGIRLIAIVWNRSLRIEWRRVMTVIDQGNLHDFIHLHNFIDCINNSRWEGRAGRSRDADSVITQ